MGLLDSHAEEPRSKRLRYAIGGVALVLLTGFVVWYLVRFTTEKHTVEHLMDAIVAENFQQAYQIWHPRGTSYTYQDFLSDFGRQGYYGPIESYRVSSVESPNNSNAVAVTVEVSPYQPFPAGNDPKSSRDKRITIWVDRGDQSLSFPP